MMYEEPPPAKRREKEPVYMDNIYDCQVIVSRLKETSWDLLNCCGVGCRSISHLPFSISSRGFTKKSKCAMFF